MITVRNKKTGVESTWSQMTYDINKKAIEQGTIHFELISESENAPTPITIQEFLQKKSPVSVVEDKPEAKEVEVIETPETMLDEIMGTNKKKGKRK